MTTVMQTASFLRMVLRDTWRNTYFQVLVATSTAFFQCYYYLVVQYEQLIANHSGSFGINNTVFFFGNLPTLLFPLAHIGAILLALISFKQLNQRPELYTFPYRNFTVPVAQAIAATLSVLAVILLNVILIFLCTLIASQIDVAYGNVPTLLPAINLLLFDLPTSLMFWSSLALLIAFVTRSVGFAFVIASGAATTHWIATQFMPFDWLSIVSSYSYGVMVLSDLAPRFLEFELLLTRAATLITSIAFCFLAAYSSAREDIGRLRYLWSSILSIALALFVTGIGAQQIIAKTEERENWVAAHSEFNSSEIVDLTSLTGEVEIQPGEHLELDLKLTLSPPLDYAASELVFSFNPGMAISRLTLDGTETEFAFEHGLLTIPCNSDPCDLKENAVLSIAAAGTPNLRFGYLEPEIDYLGKTGVDQHFRKILGTHNSVFNKQFVALMPGSRWYPTPGPLSVDKHVDALTHAPDLFDVELNLSIDEKNWTAAGPGRRLIHENEPSSFTFQTSHEVSHFAIVASDFVSKVAAVDELEIELLLHRRHLDALEHLDMLEGEFEDYLSDRLRTLSALNIDFMDSSISLVEVPNYLRTVGGYGMKRLVSMPGVVLVKESSIPLRNIDIMAIELQRWVTEEENLPQLLFSHLLRYNQLNAVAGSLEEALAGQIHPYTYRSFDTDRVALNFLRQLAITEALSDQAGELVDVEMLERFLPLLKANPLSTLDLMLRLFVTHSPRALDVSLSNYLYRSSEESKANTVSLRNLETNAEPLESRRILYFKTSSLLYALIALHGEEKARRIIAPLSDPDPAINNSDSIEYMYRNAASLDANLGSFVREWLATDGIPSYRISELESSNITVDESDLSFLVSFDLRNDSDAGGVIRFDFLNEQEVYLDLPAVEVPARESLKINLYSPTRILEVYVAAYHSLNGSIARFVPSPQPDKNERNIRSTIEPSNWRPKDDDYVVIDNLDPGTTVLSAPNRTLKFTHDIYRLLELIPDLPRIERNGVEFRYPNGAAFTQDHWTYSEAWTMYGKYVQSSFETRGESAPTVRFTAEQLEQGKWNLDFHFPYTYPYWDQYGTYNFVLIDDLNKQPLSIDAESLSGWIRLGTFDIKGPIVHLDLVSVDPPDSVRQADAIRWQKVD